VCGILREALQQSSNGHVFDSRWVLHSGTYSSVVERSIAGIFCTVVCGILSEALQQSSNGHVFDSCWVLSSVVERSIADLVFDLLSMIPKSDVVQFFA
jgi:hypothetical protein